MLKLIPVVLNLLIALTPSIVFSGHLHLEKFYQEAWCKQAGGMTEYRLDDGTRVDCLTDEYAIEFDFAPKWAESVGQALYYGLRTGKRSGVVLIMEKEGDGRYLERLNALAVGHNIKVWITPEVTAK